MKPRQRRILLESPAPEGTVRLFTGVISLGEGQTESWETLCRVVTFTDPVYGKVEVTRDKLLSMIKNFEADVYGQQLAIDISHRPSEGAAGFIRELQLQDGRFRGRIEWTPKGVRAVRDDGYRYFSLDFSEDYEDPETREQHGPTLFGAALTTRPRVKRLDPVDPERLQLSLDGEDTTATVLSPHLAIQLSAEIADVKDKFKKLYAKAIAGLKSLSEEARGVFLSQFQVALEGITDEAQAQILLDSFTKVAESTDKQLAESGGATGSIKLDFSGLQQAMAGGGGKQLTEDDIRRLMEDDRKRLAEHQAAAKADHDKLVKRFTDAIAAHEGFDDETRRQLSETAVPLIAETMTEAQVDALARNQIALGDQIMASRKLASMGYRGQGTPHITIDETNNVKSLQQEVDKRLGLADMPEYRRYSATGGQLQQENKAFADKVLSQFDAERGPQLHREHKMLAAGDGLVSDAAVPTVFERTVIREALYNLVGLNFVNVDTATFAQTLFLPYSYRDTTAAGRNSTRVYEGGSIPRAGVIQTGDNVYPIPQKIAFEASDELRYLTGANIINWDAVSENQMNASRIIREDTEQLIFNEVLQSSDEYGATAVANENLELQADDTKTIFVLAQWPVVRPRKVYDLQGNQVGSTVNPIVVTYNSVVREEYDGTGTQAAGIYYVIDYNLGEIYLVDEAGAIQVPANTTAYTISYSYTPNVAKFDSDLGSDELEVHWDGFLYRYGLRKSVIEDDRYHMANFGLMSGSLMTAVEQAKKFGANSKRPGTELAMDGNLGRIKGIPNFKTSAPGLHMGDVRAIIGERGQTRLRMMKGWMMGELENQTDSNGRFTGKKEAYGDQFIALHTPTPLKRAYTSIVVYSATARVARAA